MSLVILAICAGFVWWCAEPLYWEVEAAIVVAPPEARRSSESERITGDSSRGFRYLTPRDIGAILTTSAVLETACDELGTRHLASRSATASNERTADSAVYDSAEESASLNGIWRLRQRARNTVAQWARSAGSWFGAGSTTTRFATSDQQTEGNSSIWMTAEVDGQHFEADRVVMLRVRAPHPGMAEDGPQFLIDLARNRLSEFESGHALDRLVLAESALDEMTQRHQEIERQMAEFTAGLTVPDPTRHAAVLDERLKTIRGQQAQLDIDTIETEAERQGVVAQLDRMEREGETKITRKVTGDNPRINELQREISELESKYATLVDFTDLHPEKAAVRQRIGDRRAELDSLPETVVVEARVEPNPAYEQLVARRQETDRKLALLAGREVALQNSERKIAPELEDMKTQSITFDEWSRRLKRAEQAHQTANSNLLALYDAIAASQQFDHIRMLEPPRVRSRMNPDRPRTALVGLCTIGLALVLLVTIPPLRAAGRHRVVAMHQIELIRRELPIRIVAEIPARPVRGLLR